MEKAVLALILGLISLVVLSAAIFSNQQSSRAQYEAEIQKAMSLKPASVTIHGEPTIKPLGTKDCAIVLGHAFYKCTYRVWIQNLELDSTTAIDKLGIAVRYKGKTYMVPCSLPGSTGQGTASGPCQIGVQPDGKYVAAFDLAVNVEGDVGSSSIELDIPPSINASSFKHYARRLLYDEQKLILGNYTFDMSVQAQRTLNIFELGKDARAMISCRDEVKSVGLNAGENAYIVMCGKGVRVEMISTCPVPALMTSSVCGYFDITVEDISSGVKGDPIALSFWKYNSTFVSKNNCGGLTKLEYYESMPFDVTAALGNKACFDNFLGGDVVFAPISEWTLGSIGWQPSTIQ